VYPEFGKFVGKDLWLPSPPGVRRLQAMGGVGGPQLSRLHHDCDQSGCQGKQEERVTKPAAKIHYSHYGLMRLASRKVLNQHHVRALAQLQYPKQISRG
jgi:hypothetical protein